MNLRTPDALVALALDIITPRAMTLTAMTMMLGLACWEMWQPDYQRLAALALWGIFVFLPVVKLETQHNQGVPK
jgi:hypothetical protein